MRILPVTLAILALATAPGCRSLCHQYSEGASPDPGTLRLGAGFIIFSSYGYDQAQLTAGPGATLDASLLVTEYGPGTRRAPNDDLGIYRHELSIDFMAARTFHDVRNAGGWADIATTSLGVRLSTPRLLEPRLSFTAGGTVARFTFEDPLRPNGRATGFYVGAGAETFLMPDFSAGVEYTIHKVAGEDNAGSPIGDWYDQLRMYIAAKF